MVFAKEKHPVKEKAQPFVHRHANSNSIAILIHGFTGSPYDMRELADFLHNQGVDVMAVRLAGHGTNIEDLMAMNYEDWVLSVDAVVREAEKESKRIFLIGYSFGANLALELASRNPKRYDGIVCLGTSIYWQQRWYYFVLYHLFKLFGIDKVRKPYVPKFQIESWESTGNYADFPTKGLGEFRDIVTKRTQDLLPRVTTPVLILHSRGDRISHPKSSDYVFEHVNSQYKEMFVLPELNHNPLRSENKDRIFNRVARFIEA
ncbi:MAG: hypothetical protein A3B31_00930 [Candidatus Komeilibacteria bacterium RIFCSPLOWO2_01_FULL_53_11]|uniref:Serine aminopeptidase S33 domain-containing protein n=1 Tax=Candidatus Komeilibacteria bacterium RIFCSPLOWO2_01_FULL_53_11 TaxID=1798552 RepID=A0A1G2BUZ1_9BACT|nr:MAG: hypothetical protein A3B31_00930 [Candidatus Komeilibacteria bacterium RIFCSPLOWO2_01_FULL_53_11]